MLQQTIILFYYNLRYLLRRLFYCSACAKTRQENGRAYANYFPFRVRDVMREVIVLSHWRHVATHVATQVAQLVARHVFQWNRSQGQLVARLVSENVAGTVHTGDMSPHMSPTYVSSIRQRSPLHADLSPSHWRHVRRLV